MNTHSVTNKLNHLLADGIVMYQKLRHYHWQVQGEQFFELHKKFEEIYDQFNEMNDETAERVMMLGQRPLATLAEALELASITEDSSTPDAGTMVSNLVNDLEKIASGLAEGAQVAGDAGDIGTEDQLTGALRDVQKDIWMLRAYLNRAIQAEFRKATPTAVPA